jgi:ATPase subunit of ABC transporter with duplicated ATPase domains
MYDTVFTQIMSLLPTEALFNSINIIVNKTIIEEISPQNSDEENYARKLLGQLKIQKNKVFQKIGTLSPGEKAKVSLVKTFFGNSNTIILDEPTNHLEIISRETIEEALLKYKGSIIFVSHDRCFVEKIATHVIRIE